MFSSSWLVNVAYVKLFLIRIRLLQSFASINISQSAVLLFGLLVSVPYLSRCPGQLFGFVMIP